jgi:molybdate transport system ATP-binding protein
LPARPRPLVSLKGVSLRVGERSFFSGIDWDVGAGEQWGIVGPNGSGKTLLASALAGRIHPAQGSITYCLGGEEVAAHDLGARHERRGQVALVSLAEQQGLAVKYSGYHQSRWNSSEANDGPTVEDLLSHHSLFAINPFEVLPEPRDGTLFEEQRRRAIELVGLAPLLRRRVKQLSNGETRRLLLARAIAMAPRLLVLDDPLAGLDHGGRARLRSLLDELADETTIVVATARPDDLQSRVTHVLKLDQGSAVAVPRTDPERPPPAPVERASTPVSSATSEPPGELLVEMNDVTVRYGDAVILDKVSFSLRRGEHCALLGPNGAGKSTLLSLLLADNPQAYANDIRLFGRQRGSGESIWDIKSRVGWVAPELLMHYPPDWSCRDVVLSGLFASIGLFATPGAEEEARARRMLAWMGLDSCKKQPLRQLSHGNQRLVLLARALVGSPDLIVLDEPCQGLDPGHTAAVNQAIDRVAAAMTTSTITVTHHEHELPACITRVLRLRDGRIVP